MKYRLPGTLPLLLLTSSTLSIAACAAGSDHAGDDDDDVAVDARDVDTAATDAPLSIDAPLGIDAMALDAGTDAMSIDAMPLTGETCTMPDAITIAGGMGSATVTGTTVGFANNYMPPTACTSTYLQDGPDHVYEIAVPTGARLTAALTPSAGFDPGLYLVATPAAMCEVAPIACLAGTDAGLSGTAENVRYDNTSGATVSVFVVVDGTSTTGGTFSLAATVATIPPTPPGDTCPLAEAVTLTNGSAMLSGTTATASNYDNNYAPPAACTTGAGNDRVYSVTVPAGEFLSATLRPTGFDATLYFIAGPATACATTPITCIDGVDDGGSGATEALTYQNTTANPVDVFVVVDGYYATGAGAYDLAISVGRPRGNTCQDAEAITLTAGMATISGTTTDALGYSPNYAPPNTCTSTYTQSGNDRVHSVAVPMGATLTATLTPNGWDGGLYVVAGPATSCDANPIVCLAGIDGASSSGAETITYTNATGATVEALIVVDSYSTTHEGPYTLAVRVQ
ncbi:MAG TPA: hypothetical protein VM261_05265 [Kofleriaceae bacterium]|nr:hypothetical protein [Kofleriaceae bacterium]